MRVDASTGAFGAAAQSAAQSRHVPLALIEATAYVNTGWEWIPTPAMDGGFGPMNITPSQMQAAASLSGHTETEIKTDLAANLDAGAALLAHYHSSGTDLAAWRPAVTATQGDYVAAEIYTVLSQGASRTTSSGESINLSPQTINSSPSTNSPSIAAGTSATATASCTATSPCWVPADPSNYSVANRGHDYPIDMIVIHDIEGSYGSAIQAFRQPGYGASAHYVVSYGGDVTQMVMEKDIAWHAGNWDYNTRSIGIEHEGFAWTPGLYTTAEYNASAQIAAAICSRWGVPLDRSHVIGHSEVPDPNNPNLFGGSDHHTDPGPYWNWTYYMAQAQADSKSLPSPPVLTPDPEAESSGTSAIVTWTPAHTCRAADVPITGYTVVMQPGGVTQTLPASATSATFTGLQVGRQYTFTVTATNADGQSSATSSPLIEGACGDTTIPEYVSYFNWFDTATPGMVGDNIHLFNPGSSTSIGCVVLGSQHVQFSLDPGQETHLTFPGTAIGGPVLVKVIIGPAIAASQRVQYYQSFNEVWSMSPSQASTQSYLQWFDLATPGMVEDNIHVLNPGTGAAAVTVSLAGASPISFNLRPGEENHVSFPVGKMGGPISISSSVPVLASQRVQYFQSFNEVVAQSAAQALQTGYFQWFDRATPGMIGDNIHLLNPGTSTASVTVSLAGSSPMTISLAPGAESHVTFPAGKIGGPVKFTASQPILASQRVQYFQSFNEVPAAGGGQAQTASHLMWFDRATPGMVGDNVHVLNPGTTAANVTIAMPGANPITFSLAAGAETHVTFPVGAIGGPITITADVPVLAAQRVQYYFSFNEVPAG
ncbi:MAG TPA: N-acetylmuramoyl-L-alanine amidase [Candidatus Dormibacteraeota bacterium]